MIDAHLDGNSIHYTAFRWNRVDPSGTVICFTCKWPRPGPLCLIFSVLHLFCPQRHECPTFINIAALFQPESFFWKYRNIHINAKWVLKISFLKFLKYIYIFYYLYVYIDNACLNFSSIVINHEGVASLYSKKEEKKFPRKFTRDVTKRIYKWCQL